VVAFVRLRTRASTDRPMQEEERREYYLHDWRPLGKAIVSIQSMILVKCLCKFAKSSMTERNTRT